MLVELPVLIRPPRTVPYLPTWRTKMVFHMVAPTILTELSILADLIRHLRSISLKPSLPLRRVLPLLPPLHRVSQSNPACHLVGQHTRKEPGLIVCPMMSKKMFRCFLLRPRQQRPKGRPAIVVRVWYRNLTLMFIGKTWEMVQVRSSNQLCSLATQRVIQGAKLRTRLVS